MTVLVSTDSTIVSPCLPIVQPFSMLQFVCDMNHILLMCAVIPENNKISFHPLSPLAKVTTDHAGFCDFADRPKPSTNFPDRCINSQLLTYCFSKTSPPLPPTCTPPLFENSPLSSHHIVFMDASHYNQRKMGTRKPLG